MEVVTALEGEVEIASSEMRVAGLGMVGRVGGEWWKEFFRIPRGRLVSGCVAGGDWDGSSPLGRTWGEMDCILGGASRSLLSLVDRTMGRMCEQYVCLIGRDL